VRRPLLEPLDDSHSRTLVANLLQIEDLPEKVRALQSRLAAWRTDIGALMPRPRTANDPPETDRKTKTKKARAKRRET